MSRGQFPSTRMRRNRMQSFSRRLMAETNLTVDDLIWPMFVVEGQAIDDPIASMPGQYRYSIDRLVEKAGEAVALAIPAIAIFPALESSMKDADGTGALDGNNLVCRAVRAVKNACPHLGIICDVALDPFTDHGHDGVIRDGMVANDETVDILCQQAVLQADAGCDIIAPSDMMDGRVGAIRSALDEAGHHNVIIMSYAAKYASAFYGPFREAVKAGVSLGSTGLGSTGLESTGLESTGLGSTGKSSYQMDPANSDEAMYEIGLDLQEGADMVIIKPGMPYLDILHRAKAEFGVPCIAYQVSGEYAMIMAAAENGWLDQDRNMMESMMAFKRAGADAVITYFAPQIAAILHSK